MAKHFLSIFLISLLIQFSSGLTGKYSFTSVESSQQDAGKILAESIDSPFSASLFKITSSSKDHIERESEKDHVVLQVDKVFLKSLFGLFWVNSSLLQFLDPNKNRLYLILCSFLN